MAKKSRIKYFSKKRLQNICPQVFNFIQYQILIYLDLVITFGKKYSDFLSCIRHKIISDYCCEFLSKFLASLVKESKPVSGTFSRCQWKWNKLIKKLKKKRTYFYWKRKQVGYTEICVRYMHKSTFMFI